MTFESSRRRFLAGALATLPLASRLGAITPPEGMHFGYAAITWGKDERQAIDDISSAGYEGIQLRGEALTEFEPAQLKKILQEHKLKFVALSSGELLIDPAVETAQLAKHTANATFLKNAGGLYLQILDQLKPYPRAVTPQECERLGVLLTELGKRTADLGVPLVYHNHLNTISEHPANLDIVMAHSDPKYVKLLLDTAHTVAGGGDPAIAATKYADRIQLVHLKDVIDIPMNGSARYPFQFVELGKGRVDLPSVFAALAKTNYKGWAVVELDRSATPKDSAVISRKYLSEKIGVKFAQTNAAL